MRLALVAVIACGAVGWGFWSVGHLPALRLSRIEVRGLRVLGETEVLGHARLRPGDSLLGPDLWRAAHRLKRLGAVKSVAMDRDLPGGIIIHIRERVPRAYVRVPDGVLYIDDDRTAFRARGQPVSDAAEIAGVSRGELRAGKIARGRRIDVVLQALDALRASKFSVRRISLDPDGDLKVILRGETLVWLGHTDDLAVAVARLRQATQEIARRRERAVTIDLRDRDRIVWRPAQSRDGG